MIWTLFTANYYAALEMLAAIVAVLIFISSVDDLFIDAWYWTRRVFRSFTVKRKYAPMTAEHLREKSEQTLAIMVPAWLEYDVIAAMIENMVEVLEYQNYVVFVGTYVNDAKTIEEVERMQKRYKQLHRVEVPHAGPTCKADCLNWVVQAIFAYEEEHGMEFAGVVLHDSEDVLHPLELKFFNYLLPRKDMIQLPVASLEREWYELVAGTYMDEFAESHAKDMVVRESVAGVVPSAGVGTCFSRRALKALVGSTRNKPFNTDSLTEDYDVGNRLGQLGMQAIFGVFPVGFRVARTAWFGSKPKREVLVRMPLSVREFFPDTFRQAYRQKARWVLGIGLQSWEQIAWQGSLAARYLLLRDRKSTITALVNVLAYVLVLQFLVFHIGLATGWWSVFYPSLFAENSWWRVLIYLNAVSLIIRCGHRIYFTTTLYGWEHGLMSLPRMVVSNFVNFMAVARAWRLYLSYLFRGKALAWDKTMHDFPTGGQLLRRRQRLGELLQSWKAVDEEMLSKALKEQALTEMPLGQILISNGWLDEETLAEAIAYQSGLVRTKLTKALVMDHAGATPKDFGTRFRAIYIGLDPGSQPILAVVTPLPDEAVSELVEIFGVEPRQRIVRESELAIGLRLLRGVDDSFSRVNGGVPGVPLLGDMLVEQGLLKRQVFENAMQTYRPDRHGRVGDYLVDQGVLLRDVIERVVNQQRQMHAELSRVQPAN
ncbi:MULTISPECIES: glycosyl transferase family protein [unclassified Polaromonas]|uniref:glycosyl transferase family protein n=1 Tax=unclassified Polaromonas TaxID=2638319 RepID=UPI000F07FD8B|nr:MULTISPECIES: glycosyl transferase family protein [unclassified Polaromonas]AYQ27419.1 glycosyl transferase family protein [Polaromonas sp. SP1]QGJ17739.1 glycosyl transferase family protein [Polaromonas sp. Pch-P]